MLEDLRDLDVDVLAAHAQREGWGATAMMVKLPSIAPARSTASSQRCLLR
jgi:hypothetical protein